MASTQPLFEIDPGWPYLLAGLGLVFGAVVLPEQAKLHQGEQQLAQMQHLVARSEAVAGAYDEFAVRVKEGDPTLMRRLAVSQLNLLPEGEVPIVRAESATVPITEWIEGSVPASDFVAEPFRDSLLSRWALGRTRLWVMGGGVLCIFVGLVMTAPRRRGESADCTEVPAVSGEPGDGVTTVAACPATSAT
jgi:hypothetical protein